MDSRLEGRFPQKSMRGHWTDMVYHALNQKPIPVRKTSFLCQTTLLLYSLFCALKKMKRNFDLVWFGCVGPGF